MARGTSVRFRRQIWDSDVAADLYGVIEADMTLGPSNRAVDVRSRRLAGTGGRCAVNEFRSAVLPSTGEALLSAMPQSQPSKSTSSGFRGDAIDDEEHAIGLCGMAAVTFDGTVMLAAAAQVSGPMARICDDGALDAQHKGFSAERKE